MSNILSAIADDLGEYERLCNKYGEVVQRDGLYGKHTGVLRAREQKELDGALRRLVAEFPEVAEISSAHAGSRNQYPTIQIRAGDDKAMRKRLKNKLPTTHEGVSVWIV